MNRYRVVGALVVCAAIAAALAVAGGAFGKESAHAARAKDAAGAAGTLTIKGLEGANGLEVQAFSWGLSNPIAIGAGGGAGTGKANVSDLNVMRQADAVSPRLIRAAATGQQFASATLEAQSGKVTLRYTFEGVFVTAVQHSGSGDGVAESVSLTYAKFDVETVP